MSDKATGRRSLESSGRKRLERRVPSAMRTLCDPAGPQVDRHDRGMMPGIEIDDDGGVSIDPAFSGPGNLPLPGRPADAVRAPEGGRPCPVWVVSTPPWGPDRFSDPAGIRLPATGDST